MGHSGIGSLNEKTLHRQLKDLYLTPGCVQEHPVDGYYVDVRSPDKLIEIQTGSFSSQKKKLERLLKENRVLLVYPVTAEKYITTMEADGTTVKSRRKSPKKQEIHHAAGQLIYICSHLAHPNLSCEVLMTEEEEIRIDDGKGSWRRRGVSLSDRVLIRIKERRLFSGPADFAALLPEDLPEEFTTADLFTRLRGTKRDAGRLSYLLKNINVIECIGKKGNSQIFRTK